MSTIQLTTNGPRFNLPHSALLEVATDIARRAASHPDLFHALLDLNMPTVTEALADHTDMDDISIEDADRIWEQGNRETRWSLLRDHTFVANLSKGQLEYILRADDSDLCAIVAAFFDFDEPEDRRIDADDKKTLYDFLKSRPEREVRKALLENDSLEAVWEDIPLTERIAHDAVRRDDYANLTTEEVKLFRQADNAALDSLARNVDEIDDRKVRKAVAQFFMEHPDPQFRQEMALKRHTPKDVLKLLAKGDDPIAAGYAMMTLENLEDEDD